MVNRGGCLSSLTVALMIVLLSLAVTALGGCAPSVPPVTPPPSEPTIARCPLDGTRVYRDEQLRRPMAILVDNDPAAWPVSGLSRACMVYELPVEGGLTRFLALYQHQDAAIVGPVRSLRSYFLPLIAMNDAVVAHVGGSAAALKALASSGCTGMLDELSLSSPFWQDAGRSRPYATFTNTDKMRTATKLSGQHMESIAQTEPIAFDELTAFTTAPTPAGGAVPQPAAALSIGGSKLGRVNYRYDTSSLTYVRTQDGRDRRDGATAIAPKTVIALTLPATANAADPEGTINLLGASGAASFFCEGIAVKGSWRRDSANMGRLTFADAAGKAIVFRPGQVWVHFVFADEPVTFTDR